MMHLENLTEESGKISFVEYTATGIFIIKIQERKYHGTQIQAQVFKIDDEVRVIYHQQTQEVYAVLNETRQILYLNEDIIATGSASYLDYAKKACQMSLMVTLFFLVAYPLFQYFMDGTLYYFDTMIHLIFLFCTLFISIFIYEIFHAKNKIAIVQDIMMMLKLPKLTGRMLQSFKLMNGYFFEFDDLYDLKELYKIRLKMNDKRVEHYLAEQMRRLNSFGLNVFEIEKCQLKLVTGELKSFTVEDMSSHSDNLDSLQEVQFEVGNQKFYSLFDEFSFTSERQIQVIATGFSDLKGQYAWLVYDQVFYLSIDKDLLQNGLNRRLNNRTVEGFGGASICLFWIFLILVIFFDLSYTIFLTGILGILYFHGKFCYSSYLKISKKRNIHAFTLQQITELLPLINLKKLNKEFIASFNIRRATKSRTGFRKHIKFIQ